MRYPRLSDMDWRIATGSIVGLIVGGALGVVISLQFNSPAEATLTHGVEVPRTTDRSVVRFPATSVDLPRDVVVAADEEIAVPDTLKPDHDSGLVETPEHGPLVTVPVNVIASLSRSGHIRSLDHPLFLKDNDLAAHLQLNELQTTQLETAWQRLSNQVRSLETNSARIREMPDGSLEVMLPELKAQIATLGEDFRAYAKQNIGVNRSEILLAVAQVDQVLENLGAERKITVHPEETGDGTWRYRTTVEGDQRQRIYVGENLPSSLIHLTGPLQMIE